MDVLVSWLGHTDLRFFGIEADAATQALVCDLVRDKGGIKVHGTGPGPVRTMLANKAFDEVHFFSNYPEDLTEAVVRWTGVEAITHLTALKNPADYREVCAETERLLGEICRSQGDKPFTLHLLLSPGTPTMAAILVLLGKTKYPATFWQTWESKANQTEIPFDLIMDVVPDLLRGPDNRLQHLAALAPKDIDGFRDIIGDSKAIRLAVGRARKAALRDVPVLLAGESGTGKEMFARAIHQASHRRAKPFLAINCAAIPSQLMEAELFGHTKGAFTGATEKRDGAFVAASGGTLFLDEVGELHPDIQAKLLRVLQPPTGTPPCTREFAPVGSTKIQRSDVRVVAATNRDLLTMIREGVFREDLFYRLAVITIKLPPLRERRTDIVSIAERLLSQINTDFAKQEPGYKDKSFSASAKAFVVRHPWSGNVRELYNALIQAAVMTEDPVLQAEDLAAATVEMPIISGHGKDVTTQPLGDGFSLDDHLISIQKDYLHRAMQEADGVKTQAAKLLGMKNYQTLDAQLKRFKIDWKKEA